MAPQLTVTKGLPAPVRCALDGAREQFLADAGFALDQHRDGGLRGALAEPDHAGHLGAAGRRGRWKVRRAAGVRASMRRISSSSASARSAFLIETGRRSAPTGLTTKSAAPARIAEITVSIEPCAVCTITGGRRCRARAGASSTPMPSRSGMTRSRIIEVDRTAGRSAPAGRAPLRRCRPAIGVVAEAADHAFEQAALDGIVVDDQNGGGHASPCDSRTAIRGLCRFGADRGVRG